MHQKEIIGFAPNLVPLVKSGEKKLTYRLGSKYDFLNIGDTIHTKNSDTGEVFALLKITDKEYINFADLPINSSDHEVYSSKEEQRKIFEQYYGRKVSDDDKVIILRFEVSELLN